MRFIPRAAALCLLFIATPATARPFTTRDLLRLEQLGPAVVDPSGRWLVLEEERRYDTASRFDNDTNTRVVLGQLKTVDLRSPGPARLSFPQTSHAGYIAGPFSPSGQAMLVYRDLDRRWEAGVVTLASRRVHWLGVGPDLADWGETAVWRSEREVLMLALAPGDRPQRQRLNQAAMTRFPVLWRRATLGRGATDVEMGSGRFLGLHPIAPAKRLLSLDLVTGRRKVLVSGDLESLSLSPDHRRLALVESGALIQPRPDELIAAGLAWKRRALRLFDLASGALTAPCPAQDLVPSSLRWSPDSQALLSYSRAAGAAWSTGGLMRITANTAACTPLATFGVTPAITYVPSVEIAVPHAEWLGGEPLVYGRLTAGRNADRPDWFLLTRSGARNLTAALPSPPASLSAIAADSLELLAEGAPWWVNAIGAPVLLPTNGRLRSWIAKRPYLTSPTPADGAPHGSAYFATSEGESGPTLVHVSRSGADWSVTAPHDDDDCLAASPLGLVSGGTDAHGVQTITFTDRLGARHVLATLNSWLEGVEFAQPREIDHSGPNGELRKSWLYLPPHLRAGERPPLLVLAYPGSVYASPPRDSRPGAFAVSDNAQIAAARGYAALVPSLPQDLVSTDPAKGWDAQLGALLDRAAATGGFDLKRVAYWGHSFGGYVGLALASQTNRFKAIIAAAATSDLISERGQSSPSAWISPEWPLNLAGLAGWSERGSQGHLMATPWTDLDRYVQNSPVFSANKINTPILLVQGDQDVVPYAQDQEMFSDLYRLGKDAELLTFFGENHTISSPPNVVVYFDKVFGFLAQTLGDPQPSSPLAQSVRRDSQSRTQPSKATARRISP